MIQKISNNRELVCFAYTKRFFTAGHVSDQRGENVNRTIKTGGMKSLLHKATFSKSFDCIAAVSRNVNSSAIAELKAQRLEGFWVGKRFIKALEMCKVESLVFSSVEKHPDSASKRIVREKPDSPKFSTVDLNTIVKWGGQEHRVLGCDCGYYTSSRKPCPCGLAAAQREGLVVDPKSPSLIDPYWHVVYHPLWQDALEALGLQDYPEAVPSALAPKKVSQNVEELDPSEGVRMVSAEIYDSLGDLEHMTVSDRILKFWQESASLEKVACSTAAGFKLAAAEMISLKN